MRYISTPTQVVASSFPTETSSHTLTIQRIQLTLERAGIRFIEDEPGGFGVRLEVKPRRR